MECAAFVERGNRFERELPVLASLEYLIGLIGKNGNFTGIKEVFILVGTLSDLRAEWLSREEFEDLIKKRGVAVFSYQPPRRQI